MTPRLGGLDKYAASRTVRGGPVLAPVQMSLAEAEGRASERSVRARWPHDDSDSVRRRGNEAPRRDRVPAEAARRHRRQPILWHIMKLFAYYRHRDFVLWLG